EPDVPEVLLVRRTVAVDLLAHGVETEIVAEFYAPDVLVKNLLHLVPHGAPFSRITLPRERIHPLLLLLLTPPARPVAVGGGAEGRLGIERDPSGERIPGLGLVTPLHEGGPVHALPTHLQPAPLHLLLRHHPVL